MFFFRLFILFTNSYIYSPPPQTTNNALSQWRMTGSEPKRLGDVEGQCRPTKAHSSHWVANDGQRRPTQVSEGPQQPMTANKGQQRQKGPKRRIWRCLGPRCVSFSFILFYSYYYETRKPTAANAGQRRPTKANDGQRRPTKANTGQRRPTPANSSQ